MDNYLMLNGKRIALTPEQYEEICKSIVAPEEKNCFERAKIQKAYYCMTNKGNVAQLYDLYDRDDNSRYDVANYCTDKAKMEQRAMWETLSRLLWRFSEQNGGKGNVCIANTRNGRFRCMVGEYSYLEPTFINEKVAEAAITEIVEPFIAAHPDFVW